MHAMARSLRTLVGLIGGAKGFLETDLVRLYSEPQRVNVNVNTNVDGREADCRSQQLAIGTEMEGSSNKYQVIARGLMPRKRTKLCAEAKLSR